MACNSLSNCAGIDDCKAMTVNKKMAPDASVSMTDKRKDILQKGKSKEAFKNNVETEIKAGKPKNQALAIAYAEKNHKDIMPIKVYKKTKEKYGVGTLKDNSGADINSPQQAVQLASAKSGQSYNQQVKNFKNSDRFGMRNRGQK